MNRVEFIDELGKLINRYSIENGSDTPDWILRDYLMGCLTAFESAVKAREIFYSRSVRGAKWPVVTAVDEDYVKKHYRLKGMDLAEEIPYPVPEQPPLNYGPRDEFAELLKTVALLDLTTRADRQGAVGFGVIPDSRSMMLSERSYAVRVV